MFRSRCHLERVAVGPLASGSHPYHVEIQSRPIGLILHVQGLDTTMPAGRALFGMLSVFSEFERSMIRDRVVAGLNRTRAKGTRLGRPPMPAKRVAAIRAMLGSGKNIREVARATGSGTATVQRFRAAMQAEVEQIATAA